MRKLFRVILLCCLLYTAGTVLACAEEVPMPGKDDDMSTITLVSRENFDQETGEVKSNFEAIAEGINLFYASTVIEHCRLLADGQLYDEEVSFTTDFIPVEGATEYVKIPGPWNLWHRVIFYDAEKTLISEISNLFAENIVTPENARYIRFTAYLSELDQIVLQKGHALIETSAVDKQAREVAEKAYVVHTALPGCDLDSVKDVGTYILYYNRTYTGIPDELKTKSLFLTVERSENFVKQTLINYDQPSEQYVRFIGRPWQKLGAGASEESFWTGKKIVWFGTSIPAGSFDGSGEHRYPDMVGAKLGATVYNESVGSSSISRRLPSKATEANPYGFDATDFEFCARCLGDPLEVKEWIIENYNAGFFTNAPAEMSDETKERIRNYSYERKVDRYLSGGSVGNVDVYVFDHGFNDSLEPGDRDIDALKAQYGDDNPYCFDTGMNFLIRRIMAANPDAVIIISGHYSSNAVTQGSAIHSGDVCEAQQRVAAEWCIPVLKLWEKLGWSRQMITTTGYWGDDGVWVTSGGPEQTIQVKDMHIRDKVHPSTDASGKSTTMIANALAGMLSELFK